MMIDEIKTEYGEGAKMINFVAAGPKSYGNMVKTPSGEFKTVMKIKGITLHHSAMSRFTQRDMARMVLEIYRE